ncbi:MAG: alpha-amylase family glycosyl hydrolase [Henriciella sp.]|nr:alpha-amylase family glycosyl hydrolase [Henriciella sp.]
MIRHEEFAAESASPARLTEWWRGASIYQIYPRSFQDTDGDGVGNLAGITERLDYVASLNVDGIWISPFFTSPMADFGYDVADYCDVDPIFGSLDDFDRLVERAHALGLKVIIDQVYCHTSDLHDWFQESRKARQNPKSDWYVWAEPKPDGSPPNNWLSVFGGPAWTWDAQRSQYYLHHFLSQQPTLNLHNPDVVTALIEAGKFWIDRGVDGFRLDALNMGMSDPALRDNPAHPDSHGMTRPFDMQNHVHSLSHDNMVAVVEQMAEAFRSAGGRDFFTIAEIGGANPHPTMVKYTSGQARLSSAYSFDFIGALEASAPHIREVVEKWPDQADQGYPSFAFSNHDCHRVATRWALDGAPEGRAERLFALIQSAVRGVVFVYQGEELGLTQVEVPLEQRVDPEGIANYPHDQGRDGARTPMPWEHTQRHAGFSTGKPWLPVDPAHTANAVSQQDNDPSSVLAFFRTGLNLRREQAALRHGGLTFIDGPASLVCFQRTLDKVATALCAVNLGPDPVPLSALPDGETWQVRLSVGLEGDDYPETLPGFSGLIAIRS